MIYPLHKRNVKNLESKKGIFGHFKAILDISAQFTIKTTSQPKEFVSDECLIPAEICSQHCTALKMKLAFWLIEDTFNSNEVSVLYHDLLCYETYKSIGIPSLVWVKGGLAFIVTPFTTRERSVHTFNCKYWAPRSIIWSPNAPQNLDLALLLLVEHMKGSGALK